MCKERCRWKRRGKDWKEREVGRFLPTSLQCKVGRYLSSRGNAAESNRPRRAGKQGLVCLGFQQYADVGCARSSDAPCINQGSACLTWRLMSDDGDDGGGGGGRTPRADRQAVGGEGRIGRAI